MIITSQPSIDSIGDNAFISNSGAITTTGDNAFGILSSGHDAVIMNSNTLSTDGVGSSGIRSIRDNAVISNSGTITTTGDLANGVDLFGDHDVFSNSGMISAAGDAAYGIYSLSDHAVINNSGLINTGGETSHGISSYGDDTVISNIGMIKTANAGANGIRSTGDDVYIRNSGMISTTGDRAHGIHSFRNGLNNHTVISNNGTIMTTGDDAHGISSTFYHAVISNSGRISTVGVAAYGIGLNSSDAVISNSGTITTAGDGAHGIVLLGFNGAIINSGFIRATAANAESIHVEGALATVTLLRGSVIEGRLFTDQTDSVLNIKLGAGASYALQTTGNWIMNDLDGRPMVTGSAYAAGIGAQETAAQMLYQRSVPLNISLDQRLATIARADTALPRQWLDVYGTHLTRQGSTSNTQRMAFSNTNYGVIVGMRLPFEPTVLEAIANVENGQLNIDDGNQKLTSNSAMLGLIAPQLMQVMSLGGATLSAKALVGYGNHNGERRVLNNIVAGGVEQVGSDFSSGYATVGAALTRHQVVSSRLNVVTQLGMDLQLQHTAGYRESAYFAWDSRTLAQAQARLKVNGDYALDERKTWLFAEAEVAHRSLMSGATQRYRIQDTAVSYQAPKSYDTYIMLQVGARRLLARGVQLMGAIGSQHSADRVSGVQASIRLMAEL